MKHITTQDALRALEEAVAEKGEDYVYSYADDDPRGQTCMYVYDGAPSCLVGDALHRLGMPLAAFEGCESEPIWRAVEMQGWPIDPDAVDILAAAQGHQDGGGSWGDALDLAREEARALAVTPDA